MKFRIDPSKERSELLQKLASRNKAEAMQAQIAIAEFIGPVIQEVINKAPTVGNLYQTLPFDEDSYPSIPLDLYLDVREEDFIQVWSQAEAGGLPFNAPTPPQTEMKFSTYTLDSAIAFSRKYAQQSRLDVLAKSMERMMQEVLIKQETNATAVMLRALALAQTNVNGTQTRHIIRSQTANRFILDDFNRLFTLIKRIHSAWNGGTPDLGRARGLTDIIVSPEIVQEMRSMAYNPINTRGGVVTVGGGTDTSTESAVTLTEQMRQAIFDNTGIPEFFGINVMEIHELGIGYKYNDLFGRFSNGVAYPDHPSAGAGTSNFNANTEQIIIGLDMASMDSLLRPVVVNRDSNSQFTVEPDDQFVQRSGKIGFYGSLEEGRVILDDRVLTGIIV